MLRLSWPKWTYGPSPPVNPTVTLWCKNVQLLPLRLRDGPKLQRNGRRRTVWSAAMIAFVAIWWLISLSLFTQSFWRIPEDTSLSGCAENWHVWKPDCGVNATGCLAAFEPLPDGTRREMRLKCPVGCVRGSWKWGETLVGMQSVQYRPYVIGGGLDSESDVQEDEQEDYEESDLHVGRFYKRQEEEDDEEDTTNRYYRADSSPCAAALHAGLVSPYTGGSFRLRFEGPRESFMGSKGAYTIDSIDFDAPFPASFSVHEDHVGGGKDNRISIVAFCMVMSVIFSYLCVNVAGFYWVQFLTSFWLLVMVADPIVDFSRAAGPNSLTVREVWLSMAVERLLPAALGGYIIYRAAVKNMIGTDENPARTPGGDDGYANVGSVSNDRVDENDDDDDIDDNDASDLENGDSFKTFDQVPRSLGTPSLSRTLLWTTGLWCGILENYTFANLPVDRLMVSDLNARPEGWIVVIVFVIIIIAAIASQTYLIWRAGLFQRYIVVYVALVLLLVGLGLVGALNNLELRIHHYIIGLVLITGASTYTHLGLLYQGLLVGLYINGVGRWGFDSTLESPSALARGSVVNEDIELMLVDSELTWGPPPGPGIYTPSLMVDDVVVLSASGMDDGVDVEYLESVVGRRPTFIRAGYVDGGYSLPLVL
ncbi:hypothetical protein CJU89_1879 [Yarrowia sp. B02]|nr:hypothetical protein CJU89_1879 [Yarrowia sp. B02]